MLTNAILGSAPWGGGAGSHRPHSFPLNEMIKSAQVIYSEDNKHIEPKSTSKAASAKCLVQSHLDRIKRKLYLHRLPLHFRINSAGPAPHSLGCYTSLLPLCPVQVRYVNGRMITCGQNSGITPGSFDGNEALDDHRNAIVG